MNYNLKDLFTSIKLNTHKFEELSFAGSYFTMPKKELSNILFAENKDKESQAADIENDYLDASYIEIDDNKKSLMDKIKDAISNIFKPKPKTYRLTDGQSVEINGTMPGNPIVKFFNRIADSLDKIKNKGKDIKDATTITNEPQIISEHPAVINDKTKTEQDPTLLTAAKEVNPNVVIPGQTGKIPSTGSYINSTPKAITVENVHVDKEEILNDNKDKIATLIEESDSKQTKEQHTPTEPTVINHDDKSDDYTI